MTRQKSAVLPPGFSREALIAESGDDRSEFKREPAFGAFYNEGPDGDFLLLLLGPIASVVTSSRCRSCSAVRTIHRIDDGKAGGIGPPGNGSSAG
jgi:hypothetical protein